MHLLHVTPHLPPDQAANALFPAQLGTWMRDNGHSVEYVAHPPRAAGSVALPGSVTWVVRRSGGMLDRALRVGVLPAVWRIRQALEPAIARAHVIHVHSNGLLSELAVLLARRRNKPVVLTLYGTEVWHYRPKWPGPDLFTRAYHAASCVTFYSERLLAHARELGLTRRGMEAIYPPVGSFFQWHDEAAQAVARTALGISNRHLLVNVKRLHPLAGQRDLVESMNEVIRTHPDTRLVFCGTGPLLDELKTMARSAGVERHVIFAGLVDNSTVARYCAAADLFVLPSLLEALPTVVVEALACGTPVISSDNPGGLELQELFGPDVAIVPREQPMMLAGAITYFLQQKHRTSFATRATVDREFRLPAIGARYLEVYAQISAGSRL